MYHIPASFFMFCILLLDFKEETVLLYTIYHIGISSL